MPDNLLESELFGYKKGAFTGADKDKPGRFALAGDGTIFLDEIGEISQAMQVRLLRVLQERVFEPLGGTKVETTQARVIAATNRDLLEMVRKGDFREDLYYRINVVPLQLPPLRARREDIPLLVDHFISRFNQLQNKHIEDIEPEALSLLLSYDWPGNVRQLENVIERAFVICTGSRIGLRCMPHEIKAGTLPEVQISQPTSVNEMNHNAEADVIMATLVRFHYNREATARHLGIHKTTLYRKMRKHGLSLPEQDGRSADLIK